MSDDLPRAIREAEAAMARSMRQLLGSPSEQYERLECMIEDLGQLNAAGIDRSACGWWRSDPMQKGTKT